MFDFISYPRTKHLEDSCLQDGDDGMGGYKIKDIPDDVTVVYEEKIDGANAGFRFDSKGDMYCQSRGHFLNINERNYGREADWKLYKDWLKKYEDDFLQRFEDRYIVFGEWCSIVHSVYYDSLPHYFMEFDIFDLHKNKFLSTDARQKLIEGLPIESVPVLYSGKKQNLSHLKSFALKPSLYQSANWEENLKKSCDFVNDDYNNRLSKMVSTMEMEGIYIKIERGEETIDRFKWVNPNFKQTIASHEEHWQSRFPVPNLLGKENFDFPQYLINIDEEKKFGFY